MSKLTPDQMRAQIMAAPDPLDGPPIYSEERGLPRGMKDDNCAYGVAAEAAAKAMLLIATLNPALLDVTAEEKEDPRGFEAADNRKLWDATKSTYPGLDDWLGGITGFQFGWAHNAVRYALGAPAVGNPALVTIRVGETK